MTQERTIFLTGIFMGCLLSLITLFAARSITSASAAEPTSYDACVVTVLTSGKKPVNMSQIAVKSGACKNGGTFPVPASVCSAGWKVYSPTGINLCLLSA